MLIPNLIGNLPDWSSIRRPADEQDFVVVENSADTIDKLSYDLFYIKHPSFWFDVHILGRSVSTMVTGFGAL